MRSVRATPIGCRSTCPLVGYSGSMTELKRAPWYDAFHLAQEILAARSLLLQCVLGAGKTALAHVDQASRIWSSFACIRRADVINKSASP